MSITSIFTNPMFYGALAVLGLVYWAGIRKFVSGVPFIKEKNNFILVAVLLACFFGGVFSMMNLGSIGAGSSGAVAGITALQVTTSFLTDAGGSISENSNIDDLIDVRMTDAQANETTSVYEVDTGIITITRSGDLKAMSYDVDASYNNFNGETASTQGNGVTYHIVETDTLGQPSIYLKSGGAAATTDPKGKTTIAFAEGVATATLGVLIQVDEESHDALAQYSYKDVVVSIGGKPYTFRLHRMD